MDPLMVTFRLEWASAFSTGLVVACMSLPASSQTLLRSMEEDYWPNGASSVILPRLAVLEDRDGDGLPEFLIGDDYYDRPVGTDIFGRVSVISSRTGLEIIGYSNTLEAGAGQAAVALGDVDGDGVIDIGSASLYNPNGGPMIWSGGDLSLLFRDRHAVGASMVAIGDLTDDRLPEIAYGGSPFRVLEGGTFRQLYSVPSNGGGSFGWRSVALGDVNGDRLPDFAISAPSNPFLGNPCRQAFIHVHSGANGALLYTIPGRLPCDGLGLGMVAPGDVNGDDVGDLAARACFEGVCCIRFYDGSNGSLLGEACDELGLGFFGYVLEAVGDVNGNGFGDVLARGSNTREIPPPFSAGLGEAWLIDGGTREFLYRVTYPRPLASPRHLQYALAFTACGDWNDDGQIDLAIAAPAHLTLDSVRGAIDIFSGFAVGVRALPDGCDRASTDPRIGASGIPVLGRRYALHVTDVEPGMRAWLLVGTALLGTERARLGSLPRGGSFRDACGPRVQPDQVIPTVAVQAGGRVGAATAHWKIPSDPALAGTKVYLQWLVPGARSTAATRVLEITIQAAEPLPYVPAQ